MRQLVMARALFSQAHMQSGMVPSHHQAPTHPTMMLMATQGPPGGPQPHMQQTALNPIPVSSTAHFSYLAHPQGTSAPVCLM